ncbi:HIT family protein [Solibacillus sp. R5-41]|uniref:HIT family protein n=1 Tax=Solibacillus sp. R5-41 TaxID=2048654 RepID=UPI000C126C52|nr:HIT family protein [Solibacillus sp. R5-41]ATP39663.1 HIT family protein [Solibacillus sp. R5-41]
MNCIGCRLANKVEHVYVIYEDEFVCCFLDHDPFNEGHVLMLPKQHARFMDELDEKTAHALMESAKIVSKAINQLFKPDGITICQNGGIFDELKHFHMHVVPRYKGQNFAAFYSEDEEGAIIGSTNLEETQRKFLAILNG